MEIYPRNNSHSLDYHCDENLCNTDSKDLYQQRGVKTVIDFKWDENFVVNFMQSKRAI